MELLKRFEEDSLDDSPLLDNEDGEDEDGADDLQRRLQSIDLGASGRSLLRARARGTEGSVADTASYDELWNALTPVEREKFQRAVADPNSELAQQLLASEELEKVQVEPWWEPQPPSNTISAPSDASTSVAPKRKCGAKPSIFEVPESLVKQVSDNAVSGPLLLYNICALW